MVIDENGDISSARDYYAYGDKLREYIVGNEEKYKFTGKERDSETGFDYFGARYYDNDIGRWTSVDPLADRAPGWSPYNYTFNNPLKYTDPDGNWPINSFANREFSSGFLSGFTSSISNTITGTWNAITNPVETAEGIYNAFSNPGETLSAIGDGISQTASDLTSSDPSVSGEALGNVTAGVVEAVAGTKGATKLNSIRKVSNAKKAIKGYLGKGSTGKLNSSGDLILQSSDKLKQVRFDFNNPSPHKNKHTHVIKYKKVKNKKVETDNERIFHNGEDYKCKIMKVILWFKNVQIVIKQKNRKMES